MNSLFLIIVSALLIFLLICLALWLSHSSLLGFNDSSQSFNNPRVWLSPYECGCLFSLHGSSYFSFTYLSLLVLFVLFDLEIVLILNLPLQGDLFKSFWYYFFFVFVLVLGYSLEAYRGYANWSF